MSMKIILPAASGLLYITALALLARLHAIDHAVGWLRDPVSDYGVGRHARLFRTYGHIGTAAAVLLALQLFVSRTPVFSLAALVSMALLPVCRIGVVLIPTDRNGATPATARGRLHLLFAVATFAATYTAVASATPAFPPTVAPLLVTVLVALRHVALVGLTAVVVTLLLPFLRPRFGLAERTFLLSTLLWFLVCNLWFIASLSAPP